MRELERILGKAGAAEKARLLWQEMAPKVIQQSVVENQKPKLHLDLALAKVADIEGKKSYVGNRNTLPGIT